VYHAHSIVCKYGKNNDMMNICGSRSKQNRVSIKVCVSVSVSVSERKRGRERKRAYL
jgi:hypothetical protein